MYVNYTNYNNIIGGKISKQRVMWLWLHPFKRWLVTIGWSWIQSTCMQNVTILASAVPRDSDHAPLKVIRHPGTWHSLYACKIWPLQLQPFRRYCWCRTKFKWFMWPHNITFKARRTGCPVYIASLHSSDGFLFTIPFCRLSIGNRTFGINAPRVCNNLTHDCRASSSIACLKCNLKTELFNVANPV